MARSVKISLLSAPVLLSLSLSTLAQTPPAPAQGPGVQSARDAREPGVLATCKHPPPPRPAGAPVGFTPLTGVADEYSILEIKGVIAGGARWKTLWTVDGNNADGILGTKDGGVLIAQNNDSAVVKLDQHGKTAVVFKDTNTGGALSMSKRNELFIVQRGLYPSVWQLEPKRKLLANSYMGDPLDCLGSVINDLTADSRGGVYFTDGGLFYADSRGAVTRYGDNLTTNGIILSADEKSLYVTNADEVAVFDVQANGSLIGQRTFAKLSGAGDGMTIDGHGRLYVTVHGKDGINVFSAQGERLGSIPTPYPVISLAFGGPAKSTLYAVAETGKSPVQAAAILAVDTIASGYAGRAK